MSTVLRAYCTAGVPPGYYSQSKLPDVFLPSDAQSDRRLGPPLQRPRPRRRGPRAVQRDCQAAAGGVNLPDTRWPCRSVRSPASGLYVHPRHQGVTRQASASGRRSGGKDRGQGASPGGWFLQSKVRPSRPANTSCGRRELALLPENPPRGRTPTRGAARVLGRDTGFARECLSHLPKPKPNDRVFLTTQLPPRQRIQDPETTQTMKSIPCRRLRAGTTYLQRPRTMPRRASAAHGANGGSKHQRLRWSLGARPRSARSPGRSCQPGVKELA